MQSLSRQSSLAEDRINSSDEDEFLEERAGMCSNYNSNISDKKPKFQSRACNKDTCFIKYHQHSTSSSLSLDNNNSNNNNNQPDILKEVLAQSSHLKTSQTENDLKRLINLKSGSFDASKSESFSSLRSCDRQKNYKFNSDCTNLTKINSSSKDENKIRFKKRRNPLARSCISQ